jgi:hypothetical protein
MKMKKLAPFLIPDSHKRICESGLSGQRHGRNVSDVDELLALLTGNNTLCILEGAKRSRSPQMNIVARLSSQLNLAIMPLSVQEIRANIPQEPEKYSKKLLKIQGL